MTKANQFETCRHCGKSFKKPVKRAVFCSLHCAVWSKIEIGGPKECWEWQGSRKRLGYGSFSYNGKAGQYPHRAVLSLKLGRPLRPDEETRHRCDNPPCCNPDHLVEGSRSDNMRDAVLRGRSNPIPPFKRGEAHYTAKLTEDIVREIRASAETEHALARRYGVGPQAIHKVRKRRTWKHI
jgi:hypothetical protein